MFKLVVLAALFVAVAAKPGVFLASPYTVYSSAVVVAPATTTITKSASSIVHPSPTVYSAPLVYSHFIKKRSPGVISYSYALTTYFTRYPYTATRLLPTSVVHSPATVPYTTSLPYTTAHLIKKRSAPLLVAPAQDTAATLHYSATYVTPVIFTPLIHSTPLISSPITYATHFVKKRSAPLLTTYVALSSYSHQSRVDITHNASTLKYVSYPATFFSQPYYY